MALKILWAFVLATALALPALGPAGAQDAPRFVSVIDDLPLMAGLSETGEGVEFATPEGRLAETVASGAVTQAAVLGFYAKTLPQLGWTPAGDARFIREGETLELRISQKDGVLSVRFSLAPFDP